MLSYKDIPDIAPLLLALVASYCPALVPGSEGSRVDFPFLFFLPFCFSICTLPYLAECLWPVGRSHFAINSLS